MQELQLKLYSLYDLIFLNLHYVFNYLHDKFGLFMAHKVLAPGLKIQASVLYSSFQAVFPTLVSLFCFLYVCYFLVIPQALPGPIFTLLSLHTGI